MSLLKTLVLFIVFDFIWLVLINRDMYNTTVKKIQGSDLEVRWLPAVASYIMMALAIECFVTDTQSRWKQGAMLGLVIYGIFNGTCRAIFKEWDDVTAAKDTLWGIFVFGLVAQLT